jgi:hypothetical protein
MEQIKDELLDGRDLNKKGSRKRGDGPTSPSVALDIARQLHLLSQ